MPKLVVHQLCVIMSIVQRKNKVLLGYGVAMCIGVAVCLVAYNYLRQWAIPDIFDVPPVLVESKSPANLGQASFVRESAFVASSIYFYVLDPAASSKPSLIGGPYASDGDIKMQEAVWSKDGSVIAVHAQLGEASGHKFSKKFGEFFVDAYDFRKHKSIGVGASTRQKSQLIKGLIISRGGRGKTAIALPYASGEEVSEEKMRQFKR